MPNLNEHNMTAETVRQIENTPDSRLQEIMTSLIEHLHHFAREVKLTEAEWIYGIIQFLKRTGHLCTDIRQEFTLSFGHARSLSGCDLLTLWRSALRLSYMRLVGNSHSCVLRLG
jgi:hypothetical protein